jgi:hypothetical protein
MVPLVRRALAEDYPLITRIVTNTRNLSRTTLIVDVFLIQVAPPSAVVGGKNPR